LVPLPWLRLFICLTNTVLINMKKIFMNLLQILSMFLFIVLITAIVGVIREIFKNDKGLAFNLGYGLCAIVVIGLLFWLNAKLYKFLTRNQ